MSPADERPPPDDPLRRAAKQIADRLELERKDREHAEDMARRFPSLEGRPNHFILEGREPKPVGLFTWAYWRESVAPNSGPDHDPAKETRRVAWTALSNGVGSVSTVFLGLDHSFSRSGPPILFEIHQQDRRRVGGLLRPLRHLG